MEVDRNFSGHEKQAPKITHEEIEQQTEQFLQNGGKIQHIEPGRCAYFEKTREYGYCGNKPER